MNDHADVLLIHAHSECRRGHNGFDFPAVESILVEGFILRIHSAMVRQCTESHHLSVAQPGHGIYGS
jgi:hypothetical protein